MAEIDDAELRLGLSQLLDDACGFLRKATTVSKMFQKAGSKHNSLVEKLHQKQTLANAKVH